MEAARRARRAQRQDHHYRSIDLAVSFHRPLTMRALREVFQHAAPDANYFDLENEIEAITI